MDAVLDDFEERVREVDKYLKVLERLEDPAVSLYHRTTQREMRVFEEGSLKVMKATVFLLIYNVVESAIRSAFGHLYKEIEANGSSCADLRDEIRRVWLRQRFHLDDDSASARNYRDLANKLAEEIIQRCAVRLSQDRLPVSGNLDAVGIRKVCQEHGVPVKSHHRARGGCELETVKAHRNALAHGNMSFSTCGQQYTVADLKRIKQQAFVFVRSILRNIRRFVDEKHYVAGK